MGVMGVSEQSNPITIHIVDDHEIFQTGILDAVEKFGMKVTGRSSNGYDALHNIRAERPDIVLMDIGLPDINGVHLARQLTQERIPSRIILITGLHDPAQTLYAMRSGAWGYLSKGITATELIKNIETVAAGYYIAEDLPKMTPDQFKVWMESQLSSVSRNARETSTGHYVPLSPRELEILTCLTMGMSNKEIAQHLHISQQTVKNHMTSIMTKMNVSDRTQAALTALRNGWVSR
jgi:DNA-binding NarL/FixJ family response regulator